ncbi:dihydrofolate reductase [Candidatus Dependentiae bacterium]|nr:dihydrofolate reductase [Candidatus Dependentiae bacterium]
MAYTILYIASSEGGFIADKKGGLDWLPQEAPEGEDFGFEKFLDSIDVIAQGSRTFLQTISFIEQGIVPDLPYGGKHMYVFTREPMQTNRTDVTFVSSIDQYLNMINQDLKIKRVWLLGGAEVIKSFKDRDLIDKCIITVIPVVLHEGISLPKNLFEGMKLVSSKNCFNGIIEKRYIRINNL